MNAALFKKELKKIASEKRAHQTKKFFKTGPGEYGENDQFIGVSNPDLRKLIKKYPLNQGDNNFLWIEELLRSFIHEERLLGILYLVEDFNKSQNFRKKEIFDFYLKNKRYVNNWDLVDLSAPQIVGKFKLIFKKYKLTQSMLLSPSQWDRRIAIVSHLTLIKNKNDDYLYEDVLTLIKRNEVEDLMHKACGWMLREAGKKNLEKLEIFLLTYGKMMPRTMLRYAIEKFEDQRRKYFLKATRS